MKDKEKAHGVQLLIRAVVKDPDGKIIEDTGQKPAKSFVIAFLRAINQIFDYEAAERDAVDIFGVMSFIASSGATTAQQLVILGLINNSSYGIVVGTGNTAVTNADYKLETRLSHGAGVGNISYGVGTMGTASVVGPNVDLPDIKRTFTNNTGVLIVVREVGIYSRMTLAGGKYHCLVRDVLAPSINVPDKCSLTIYYTFRTTV